jgi:hypothetical protein
LYRELQLGAANAEDKADKEDEFTGVGFFGTEICKGLEKTSRYYRKYIRYFYGTLLAGAIRALIREVHG